MCNNNEMGELESDIGPLSKSETESFALELMNQKFSTANGIFFRLLRIDINFSNLFFFLLASIVFSSVFNYVIVFCWYKGHVRTYEKFKMTSTCCAKWGVKFRHSTRNVLNEKGKWMMMMKTWCFHASFSLNILLNGNKM